MFGLIQNLFIKILFRDKEKLLAIFIKKVASTYQSNKVLIAKKVIDHLPVKWRLTATPDEVSKVLDLTIKYIDDIYDALKSLRT